MVVLKLVAFILLVLVACVLAGQPTGGGHFGGGRLAGGAGRPRPKSQHVVVDTLNALHWLAPRRRPGLAAVLETVAALAPRLRERYAGRIVFVLKDADKTFADKATHDALQAAAEHSKVHIAVAEKYFDPPAGPTVASHSARGRDDFYTAVLAAKYDCEVLTNDAMRDFASFATDVPPFHVYEFVYWKKEPNRDYINPQRLRKLRRPRTVRFDRLL